MSTAQPVAERIIATYRLRTDAAGAAARAGQLALEQSIEMPAEAVMDERVLQEVVARVLTVQPIDAQHCSARIALSVESVGVDAGQLMNMLFGNCSLQPDVELVDVELPAALAAVFGGPTRGLAGIRRATGNHERPLTCTALKPIGSTPAALAAMCETFAAAGIDIIKDDHGWADQASAPFTVRVAACQEAVERANARRRDGRSLYAPSLYGNAEQMHAQLRHAVALGVEAALIAPMVCGVATFHALRRAFPQLVFLGHPSLGGNRIEPAVLFGKLFRLFGADAVIFPNHGGRFSYPRTTCEAIARHNRMHWLGLAASCPTPAGGMTLERVPEIVRDYGRDTMLLIGGALLQAREQLAERTARFIDAVRQAEFEATAP